MAEAARTEIHQLARYEVRPEALDACLAPVEFIDYTPIASNLPAPG